MKSFLSEEDKLKLTIRKNYLERDAIKTKILNYLNRLSHLCSDDKDELNRRERQKRGFFEENSESFPEFKIEKRPKIEQDETTVTRNRRLLQVGLLEHLKKAKDALEQEKSNEKVIRQQMQNKRVEQKLQEEKKKFEKHQLDDIEKRIITHIKEIKNVDTHIKTDEAKLMKLTLINHYEKMKNFISTNCQPTIFWCPFKFNSKTEILQKETDNFIRKKIEAIKESNYDVDFEEEPWVVQFENLKEIVRRRNGQEGEATGVEDKVDHEEKADQEGDEAKKEGKENHSEDEEENNDEDEQNNGDDENKDEEDVENEDEENDDDKDDEDDEEVEEENYKDGEDDDEKEGTENEEEEENEERNENQVGKESSNGSHYTEEKEEDTEGTPKKSPSNDSEVNTSQNSNTCQERDNISNEDFYPDNAGDEDLKCREVSEANAEHDADRTGEQNGTDEPNETNETVELDEANAANVTNETNEANEANETNETVGDNDGVAVKKNARKRRGRPKKKRR
ncbi:conserved Plasmodium protein, unknown function [Plasmodium knowlesi strain H]|uniref:Pinin/SDK/MemA protein domain-containing protein n=3 Tax=Plasmodium knowlesi TaxID=5850 RepID=A0A5K1VJZ1_PLAKH|nr:pinin/SDK/MemA domain-containing protein, putative [Plasmodium knowlesi strain H]OTN63849.1 Uncharacterized protein PKNOH_S140233100 [Plasmodium knowlesi]CAA9990753.1 pinin/SDK/MemA domain-containing protein, putative [Plasmodium knowlesi strain H]SBO21149.1 conserved Plasmodium protein, unknown function [Plasmodium knowlesi strain H]SBO21613.1 conserved Plasmodium protein, unknown function [Plasmodium knowlesi strain H]VVS80227.1 pinin/SDK/MemA domain-containing protein, putative [Plasmodi|eukprot:XP_002262042.1 hypothetical protein, conserved in Plasmodium species [Plasmodium knowlesi strain H]